MWWRGEPGLFCVEWVSAKSPKCRQGFPPVSCQRFAFSKRRGRGSPPKGHLVATTTLAKPTSVIEAPPPSRRLPSAIGEESADHCSAPAIGGEGVADSGSSSAFRVDGPSGGAQPQGEAALKIGNMFSSPAGPWTLHGESELSFEANELLGSGADGKVYGGTFGRNSQAVALKLLERFEGKPPSQTILSTRRLSF